MFLKGRAFASQEARRKMRMATTVDNRRETVSLIGSDKVEGTPVYGRDDNKIGTVQRVMIDKTSGKVAYAVMSFGGFLGMGEDYFPMPWTSLKYDTNLGGYRVGVTEDQLKGAPRFNRSTDWDWSDRARDRTVYDYYKTPLWY
jgi:hypothetical protein